MAEVGYHQGLNLVGAPEIDAGLFIGRETELQQITEILSPDGTSRKVLAIGGLGGVGKTQLAIAYSKRSQNTYTSIFWLNAASEKELNSSLVIVAQKIFPVDKLNQWGRDEKEYLVHISKWLSEQGNDRWLLIFDNYDDPSEYEITKYYPYTSQGSILITTRVPEKISGTKAIRLRALSNVDESLKILQTRSGRETTDPGAFMLAKRLDGFPLALATAGSFLRKAVSISFQEYLQKYEEKWNVTPKRPVQLQEYQSTLYTTWDISFTKLQADHPEAANLLSFFGYFSNHEIWYELIQAADISDDLDYPTWFFGLARDRFEFSTAMATLTEYSFVETLPDSESYSLHSCVHDWVSDSLNKEPSAISYRMAARCVAKCALRKSNYTNKYTHVEYGSLAVHGARLASSRFANILLYCAHADREDFTYSFIISSLLMNQGEYHGSERLLKWTLPIVEQRWSQNESLVWDMATLLSIIYRRQGRTSDAEDLCKRTLAAKEEVLGFDNQDTLLSVYDLASVYRRQKKLHEAEKLYQRALKGQEQLLGEIDAETLVTVSNLGLVYRSQNKLDKAEEMYQRALAGMKLLEGKDHRHMILTTMHNLAVVLDRQGRYVEAEKMYHQILADEEQLLGQHHESIQTTRVNIALSYEAQGKLAEAERMLRMGLTGMEDLLGPDHPRTKRTARRLSRVYRNQGKILEANELHRRFGLDLGTS